MTDGFEGLPGFEFGSGRASEGSEAKRVISRFCNHPALVFKSNTIRVQIQMNPNRRRTINCLTCSFCSILILLHSERLRLVLFRHQSSPSSSPSTPREPMPARPSDGHGAGGAGSAPRLKLVIRRLPPALPEETFWKSVAPFVTDQTCQWKRYIKGRAADA